MCDYVCLYVYIMFYYAYIQYSLNIYIYIRMADIYRNVSFTTCASSGCFHIKGLLR